MTEWTEYQAKRRATIAAAKAAKRSGGSRAKRPTETRVFQAETGWRWECACGASSWRHGMSEALADADLAGHRRTDPRHQSAGWYDDRRLRRR